MMIDEKKLIEDIHECRNEGLEGGRGMTNLEKVRNMDIDDLAFVLMCPFFKEPDEACGNNCMDCVRDWLRREAEDD